MKNNNKNIITMIGKKVFVGHAMVSITPGVPQNYLRYIGTAEFWQGVNIKKVNDDRRQHGAPIIEGKILLRNKKGYQVMDAQTGAIEDYEGHSVVQMIPVGTIENGILYRPDGKPYDKAGNLFLHVIGRGPEA